MWQKDQMRQKKQSHTCQAMVAGRRKSASRIETGCWETGVGAGRRSGGGASTREAGGDSRIPPRRVVGHLRHHKRLQKRRQHHMSVRVRQLHLQQLMGGVAGENIQMEVVVPPHEIQAGLEGADNRSTI